LIADLEARAIALKFAENPPLGGSDSVRCILLGGQNIARAETLEPLQRSRNAVLGDPFYDLLDGRIKTRIRRLRGGAIHGQERADGCLLENMRHNIHTGYLF